MAGGVEAYGGGKVRHTRHSDTRVRSREGQTSAFRTIVLCRRLTQELLNMRPRHVTRVVRRQPFVRLCRGHMVGLDAATTASHQCNVALPPDVLAERVNPVALDFIA